MTPSTRLSTALRTLCWGPLGLAALVNVNRRTVARWMCGQNQAPERVLAWLERLARFHVANPPPDDRE